MYSVLVERLPKWDIEPKRGSDLEYLVGYASESWKNVSPVLLFSKQTPVSELSQSDKIALVLVLLK